MIDATVNIVAPGKNGGSRANAGAKKFPFDQPLELISRLGEEGLSGLLAKPAPLEHINVLCTFGWECFGLS